MTRDDSPEWTRDLTPRWSHGYRTRKAAWRFHHVLWRRLWMTLACVAAITENNLFLEFFSSSNVKCDDFKKETRWEQIARTRHQARGFSLTAVRATKSTRVELNSSVQRHRNQLTLRPPTRITLPMLLDLRTTAITIANVSVDHARRPTFPFSPQASALNRPQPSHCPSRQHRGSAKGRRAPAPLVRRPASRSASGSHWTFRLTAPAHPVPPSTPRNITIRSRPSAATTTTHKTWSSYWTSPHNWNQSNDKQTDARAASFQCFLQVFDFPVIIFFKIIHEIFSNQPKWLPANIFRNFSMLENMLHRQNW